MKKIALIIMVFCSISLYAQNGTDTGVNKPIEIGDEFRELVLIDTTGVKVKLSDYCGRGNYTLIEFGVSWCGPCKKDVPILKGVYDKYHPHGLNLVSVFLDEKRDSWTNFITKNAINWIHLSDLTGWEDSKAATVYDIKKVPFYLLINPQGKVIYKSIGTLTAGNTLAPKLKEIYGF